MSVNRTNFLLLLVSAAISGLLLELGARFYLAGMEPSERLRYATPKELFETTQSDKSRWQRHYYLGYLPRPNLQVDSNRHNSLGFRGDEIPMPKPAGEFRIVCLGGSTTYTSAVQDYHLSYPNRLQDFLTTHGFPRVRVINGGVSDWTSHETLISLETRVLDLQPDLIVIYHAINDAMARLVWPGKSFLGDNSGARQPAQQYPAPRGLIDSSALLRIFAIRLGFVEPLRPLRALYETPSTYYGDAFVEQLATGKYPQGVFSEVGLETMLKTNGTGIFRRNLENIVAIARFNGITAVLLTFKHSPQPDSGKIFAAEQFAPIIDEMNRTITAVAQHLDVPLFDLASAFPSDSRWFADGVHVNEAGANLKAEMIGRFLIDQQLLDMHAD